MSRFLADAVMVAVCGVLAVAEWLLVGVAVEWVLGPVVGDVALRAAIAATAGTMVAMGTLAQIAAAAGGSRE